MLNAVYNKTHLNDINYCAKLNLNGRFELMIFGFCLFFRFFFFSLKNLNVTWYTDNPDFTPCFQRTVLIWFPCAFLWLFSFLEIFYIKNSINRNIPYGFLNVSKLLLTGVIIVLSIVDLAVAILNSDDRALFPVDYYTPVIKIATFVSWILCDNSLVKWNH